METDDGQFQKRRVTRDSEESADCKGCVKEDGQVTGSTSLKGG